MRQSGLVRRGVAGDWHVSDVPRSAATAPQVSGPAIAALRPQAETARRFVCGANELSPARPRDAVRARVEGICTRSRCADVEFRLKSDRVNAAGPAQLHCWARLARGTQRGPRFPKRSQAVQLLHLGPVWRSRVAQVTTIGCRAFWQAVLAAFARLSRGAVRFRSTINTVCFVRSCNHPAWPTT